MSAPALALAPVLIDDRTGAGASTRPLDVELLDRATREDYRQWVGTALAAGGCVRPIRLRGTLRDIDAATGEILRDLDTTGLPDKAIYVPCGDRQPRSARPAPRPTGPTPTSSSGPGWQAARCVPVGGHPPCVFATFTAPSFGPVHTRVVTSGRVVRCRPRRKATRCPHGRRISCGQRHKEDDACLGKPLCRTATTTKRPWCGTPTPRNCGAAVIGIRRRLDKLAHPTA